MIAVSEGHQEKAMTDSGAEMVALRVSDADRNGTMRRLHNAVALGLIDINEFEQRSSRVSFARTQNELDGLVCDLPGRVPSSHPRLTGSNCVAGPGR